MPALIPKAHEAKILGDTEYVVWGTGHSRRELLYVDDLADAYVFLMEEQVEDGIFNVGCGNDITIRERAQTVIDFSGSPGKIVFDGSKPDGTPRKLLDVSKMADLAGMRKQVCTKELLRPTSATLNH